MTQQEIINLETKAFRHWIQFSRSTEADHLIAPFQNLNTTTLVRKIREAQFLTRDTIAVRMNVAQNTIAKFEAAEENGTISINTLRKIADALGCELVYGFRTKSRQTFSEMIWEKAIAKARSFPFYRYVVNFNPHEKRKHIELATHMRVLIEDTDMRKHMGWSKDAETSVKGTFRYIDREWARWQGIKKL